jgi:hypothetical protein
MKYYFPLSIFTRRYCGGFYSLIDILRFYFKDLGPISPN